MSRPERLVIVISLLWLSFIIEMIGGIKSKSLALSSDAIHVLVDITAFSIGSLVPEILATKKRVLENFYRGLFGMISGILLLLTIGWIIVEAGQKVLGIEQVLLEEPLEMLKMAIAGGLCNLLALLIMPHHNVNDRATIVHIVADLGYSISVIVGGIIIYLTGWKMVDPLLSMILGILLIQWSKKIICEGYSTMRKSS